MVGLNIINKRKLTCIKKNLAELNEVMLNLNEILEKCFMAVHRQKTVGKLITCLHYEPGALYTIEG